MSPGPDDRQHQQLSQEEDAVVMDVIQPSSDATYPMTPSSQLSDNHDMTMEAEEVEMEQDTLMDTPVQQASRSPSQEREEIPVTKSLKLTDFEVRGTLGKHVPHILRSRSDD
jgi:hypothetical protein